MDIKRRFAEKVVVQDNDCHEWQSTMHRDGYGKFWLNGGQIQAHRASYLIHCGEIPRGAWVLRKCDNRKCVNPEHLYLGDSKQNSHDRTNRLRYGCRSGLTTEDVNTIRAIYGTGRYSQTKIGVMFGVDQTHISNIVRNKKRILK